MKGLAVFDLQDSEDTLKTTLTTSWPAVLKPSSNSKLPVDWITELAPDLSSFSTFVFYFCYFP